MPKRKRFKLNENKRQQQMYKKKAQRCNVVDCLTYLVQKPSQSTHKWITILQMIRNCGTPFVDNFHRMFIKKNNILLLQNKLTSGSSFSFVLIGVLAIYLKIVCICVTKLYCHSFKFQALQPLIQNFCEIN